MSDCIRACFVGMAYTDFKHIFNQEQIIILRKEPTNKYDANAIQVFYKENAVAYVTKNTQEQVKKFVDVELKIIRCQSFDRSAYVDLLQIS